MDLGEQIHGPSVSPLQRERFRAAIRTKLQEESDVAPPEDELEEMTAFAWIMRARELCAKADLLREEGVSDEESMRLVRVGPQPQPTSTAPPGRGGFLTYGFATDRLLRMSNSRAAPPGKGKMQGYGTRAGEGVWTNTDRTIGVGKR